MNSEFFVLRAPLFPFENVYLDKDEFLKILDLPVFKESILVSSPDLYQKLIEFNSGIIIDESDKKKVYQSLYRFFLRMSARCTPFGLFSGIAIGSFGDKSDIRVSKISKHKKYTRLDNYFLNLWSSKFLNQEKLNKEILWFANNTFYDLGDKLRYIEFSVNKGVRSHNLTDVIYSEYVVLVLEKSKAGIKIDELIEFLCNYEFSVEEAKEFIYELIDSKILISDLEPRLTGIDFQEYLENLFLKFDLNGSIFLKKSRMLINKIDSSGPGESIDEYKKLFELCFESKVGDIDSRMLVQTDLNLAVNVCELDKDILNILKDSLIFLGKTSLPAKNENLENFKSEFYKRFETQEVSLMKVMDPDFGLGYPIRNHSQADNSPLVKGININVFSKMPRSLYSLCNIIKDSENKLIVVHDYTYGPSSANLLGRFCNSNSSLFELVKKNIELEEGQDDVIFAEIVHMSQARQANVLKRPILRNYEIPILTINGINQSKVVDLNDIYVSIVEGDICLTSKRLGKRIIPRLSTAHNYSFNSLPHYHFLCDLQTQENKFRLDWDWGLLQEQTFLPRVTYKSTILSLARWNIRSSDILNTGSNENTFEDYYNIIKQLKAEFEIPDLVLLTVGDNYIPIDFSNRTAIDLFINELKKSEMVSLKECIFNLNNLIVKGSSGSFTNELVIPWINKYNKGYKKNDIVNQEKERDYYIGSEWLYFKIYCGVKTADNILLSVIYPLINEFESSGKLQKWFFIRYADPDFHIRFRIRGNPNELISLITKLHNSVSYFAKIGAIWKIQCETYKRELERYPEIDLAEDLFYFDSNCLIKILHYLKENEDANLKNFVRY